MSTSRLPILPERAGPFEQIEPLAPCPAAVLARACDPAPRLVKFYFIEPVSWFEAISFTPLPETFGDGAVRLVENRVTQTWSRRPGVPLSALRRETVPPLGVTLTLVLEMTRIARSIIAVAPERPSLLHVSNLWLGEDARVAVIDSLLVDWELENVAANPWGISTTGSGDTAFAATVATNALWLAAGDERLRPLFGAASLDGLDGVALQMLGATAESVRERLERWFSGRGFAPRRSLQPSVFSLQPDQDQRPCASASEPKAEDRRPKAPPQPSQPARPMSLIRPRSPATLGLAILLAVTALAGFLIYDALSPDLPAPANSLRPSAFSPQPEKDFRPSTASDVKSDLNRSEPKAEDQRLKASSPAPAPLPRIAAVRFRNLTGDLRWAWIEDGLPEIVATHLAELRPTLAIETTALRSAIASAGLAARAIDHASVVAAARRHQATHALTGSIAREAKEFSLTVRLTPVEVIDRGDEWSAKVSDAKTTLRAALNFAQIIAARVAPRPTTTPTSPLAAAGPLLTDNTEALTDFIRGRDALLRLDVSAAANNFERAIAKDPAFASAHVGLADALLTPWPLYERDRAAQALSAARDGARRLPSRDRARLQFLTRLLANPDALDLRKDVLEKLPATHLLALLAEGERARRRGDSAAALSAWRIAARTLAPARTLAATLALHAVDPHDALRLLALRAPGEPETFREAQMSVVATIMADDLALARKRLRAIAHDAARPAAARAWAASAAAELGLLVAKKAPIPAAPLPPPPDNVTVSFAFTAPRALVATAKSLAARGETAKARANLERVVAAWDGSKSADARAARALLKKLVPNAKARP